MSTWLFLVYFLFPIPFFCLMLLCLPLPDVLMRLRQMIIIFTSKVLFSNILGGVNLYRISVLISSLLFLISSYEQTKASSKLSNSQSLVSLDLKEDRLRGLKWRAERNFWISFMSLVLWLILYRVHAMVVHIDNLKKEIKEKDK